MAAVKKKRAANNKADALKICRVIVMPYDSGDGFSFKARLIHGNDGKFGLIDPGLIRLQICGSITYLR